MEHFGKVAKCKAGKIGVIMGIGKITYPESHMIYHGVSLDGSKWQSKDPEILADNIKEYYERKN